MKKLSTLIALIFVLGFARAQDFDKNVVTYTDCRSLVSASSCTGFLNSSQLGQSLTGGNSFTIRATGYNNGQMGDYKLISTLNYIVVESYDDPNITTDWKATVRLHVARTDDGVSFDYKTIEIPVEYSNAPVNSENHRSVYVFDGLSYSEITVDMVEILDAYGNIINSNVSAVQNMNIELYIEEERFDIDQEPWSMPSLTVGTTTNNSYFTADWSSTNPKHPQPCYFELEWAFNDSEDSEYSTMETTVSTNGLAASAPLFVKSSGKIATKSTSYPLILNDFENDGKLYVRYRRVRPTFETPSTINALFKHYSEWTYQKITVDASNRFDSKGMNWTVESTIAEDDKRKDIVNYFDGSGRSREMFTNLSSVSDPSSAKNYVMTAQSHYDYEGNAVIQMLPAPLKRTSTHLFDFKSDLNEFSTGKDAYDKIGNNPTTLTSASNSSVYYSSSNALNSSEVKYKDYIPDAKGYAYSYTEINGYGSKRPLKKTSPGETHRIGNTDKRYRQVEYAQPLQVELDLLFGNNAGRASFYKKTVETDPNGQASIIYSDGFGRTVATAKASSPANLLDIDTRPAAKLLSEYLITADNNKVSADRQSILFSQEIYVENANTYVQVAYTLDKTVMEACGTAVCYRCQYDLEVYYIDPNGKVESLVTTPITPAADCTTPESYAYTSPDMGSTGELILQKGTHKIVKVLRPKVDREATDVKQAIDDYLASGCLRSEYSFIETEIRAQKYEECENEFVLSKCYQYGQKLKQDMVPVNGMYAQDNSQVSNPTVFSLFNEITPNVSNVIFNDFGTAQNNFGGTYVASPTTDFFSNFNDYTGLGSAPNMLIYEGNASTKIWGVTSGALTAGGSPPTGKYFLEFSYLPLGLLNDYNNITQFELYAEVDGQRALTIDLLPEIERYKRQQWKTVNVDLTPYLLTAGGTNDISIHVEFAYSGMENAEGKVAIDLVRIVDVMHCNCSDWLNADDIPGGFYSGSVDEISYPYECLSKLFDEAGIKNYTNGNPSELDVADFIKQYNSTWLDVMVKMHPEYCNLILCEEINSAQATFFEKKLKSAETYDLFNQWYSQMNDLTDPSLFLTIDPIFSAGSTNPSWLYQAMVDKISNYFDHNGTTYSMAELAMISTIGDIWNEDPNLVLPQAQMIADYLSALKAQSGSLYDRMQSSGMDKLYWNALKSLYLAHREYLTGGVYQNAQCHTCPAWGADTSYVSAFPKYDGQKSPLELFNDESGLNIQNLTDLTNSVGSSMSGQKHQDCEQTIYYELSDKYSTLPQDPTYPDPFQIMGETGLVNAWTIIPDLIPFCSDPDAYPNPYIDIASKFDIKGLVGAGADDSVKFRLSPWLMDISNPFLHNNAMKLAVDQSECELTVDGNTLQGAITAFMTGGQSAGQWDLVLNLVGEPSSVSPVNPFNSVGLSGTSTSNVLSDLTGNLSGITGISLLIDDSLYNQYISAELAESGGHFFRLEVSVNGVGTPYEYLFHAQNPIWKIKDEVIYFGKTPAPQYKLNGIDLKPHVENYIGFEVGPTAFKSLTELTTLQWEANYREALTNYLNFHTGLDMGWGDYQSMMITYMTLPQINVSSVTPIEVETRFTMFNDLPSVCEDDNDISCGCGTHYQEFLDYVNNNSTSLDFMKQSHLVSSTDFTLGANEELRFAKENFLGESNNLYFIDHDYTAQAGMQALFDQLLILGEFKGWYDDDQYNKSKRKISSSFLYPKFPNQYFAGICQSDYKYSTYPEFSYDNSSGSLCEIDGSLNLDGGSNFTGPVWVNRNSDGTFWIHLNFPGVQEHADIYLNYEHYNWSYHLKDIASIDAIEPIVRETGEVYEFYLHCTLDDGREIKIFGHSTYKIAEACVIKDVVLYDRPSESRTENQANCERQKYEDAIVEGKVEYEKYVAAKREEFYNSLVESCSQTDEQIKWTYTTDVYHYTLYYYDQSGNLVQTVPPDGVHPFLRDSSGLDVVRYQAIDSVRKYRDGVSGYTFWQPNHAMKTTKEYNSLNQAIKQSSPDGGTTLFFLDEIGRVVLSQDAQQSQNGTFSYSFYDELSRVVEVGEVSGITYNTANYLVSDPAALRTDIETNGTRFHVVKTFYDIPFSNSAPEHAHVKDNQKNLLNRISAMALYNLISAGTSSILNYDNAMFYSYDIGGSVNVMWRHVQEPGLSVYKRVDYEYDLISGNVKQVVYQDEQIDELSHRYKYDADNRLTKVEISRDGVTWEQTADYEYYLHGPLARINIGEYQVQGIDFAYNLQGWIKQMNGLTDMGGDGTTYAKDVFAYVLQYHSNDYSSIGTTSVQAQHNSAIELFNGNISEMDIKYDYFSIYDWTNKNPTYTKMYQYDQLNRIKKYWEVNMDYNPSGLLTEPLGQYSFDGNGNFTDLDRWKEEEHMGVKARGALNTFDYSYQSGTNKLITLVDNSPEIPPYATYPAPGSRVQNYNYDQVGNLTQDHFEMIDVSWNPIGKVKQVSSKNMINTYGEDRDAMELNVEYGPLGHRLKRQYTRYDASGRMETCVHIEFDPGILFSPPDGDPYTITTGKVCFDEVELDIGQFYDQNVLDSMIANLVDEKYGAGARNNIAWNMLAFYEPSYTFQKAATNTEYYVRDAKGNILALYQRGLDLPRTEINFRKLVANTQTYTGYSDDDMILKLIRTDLAWWEDFIRYTYDLLGYGNNPPIDITAIILGNDDLVTRLLNTYNQTYAQEFYFSPDKDVIKNLVKNSEAFLTYATQRLAAEIELQYGSSLTQAEKEALLAQMLNDLLTAPEPIPDDFFDDGGGNVLSYMPMAFQEDTVIHENQFKTILATRLTSDPIYEEELYQVADKPELYQMQYKLQPSAYVDELISNTAYPGNTVNMIAEWMFTTKTYDFQDMLDRLAITEGNKDVYKYILGIEPSTPLVPNTWGGVFSLELSQHYLYGNSRLGIKKKEAFEVRTDHPQVGRHYAGATQYELTDHLNNVRAVITDRSILDGNNRKADVIEANDYYPYGYLMEDRSESYNLETTHWDYYTKSKMNPIWSESSYKTDNLSSGSADWDDWYHDIWMPRNDYNNPDWNKGYPGGPGYWVPFIWSWSRNTNPYFYRVYDGGDNTAHIQVPGGKNLSYCNFHRERLQYSGSGIDTVRLQFYIRGSNMNLDRVKLYSYKRIGKFRVTKSNLPTLTSTWTKITVEGYIDAADYVLQIDMSPQNRMSDAWARVKAFEIVHRNITGYTPGSGTEVHLAHYRHGFNGMEHDSEIGNQLGTWNKWRNKNSYTTEFRQYDPRIGRWFSLDPERSKMPFETPYSFSNNMPIYGSDEDGNWCVPCIIIAMGGFLSAPAVGVTPTGDPGDYEKIQEAYNLQAKWLLFSLGASAASSGLLTTRMALTNLRDQALINGTVNIGKEIFDDERGVDVYRIMERTFLNLDLADAMLSNFQAKSWFTHVMSASIDLTPSDAALLGLGKNVKEVSIDLALSRISQKVTDGAGTARFSGIFTKINDATLKATGDYVKKVESGACIECPTDLSMGQDETDVQIQIPLEVQMSVEYYEENGTMPMWKRNIITGGMEIWEKPVAK